MTTHRGSCHCGKVAFEVDGEITSAISCNCSICQRKGWLLMFVPASQFRLLTPDENAGTYLFNRHVIRHRFCTTCGINPYADGADAKGNPVAAINIRCIEGIELDKIPVKHFDGRAL